MPQILSAEVCDTLREIKREIIARPDSFDMSWFRCIGRRLARMNERANEDMGDTLRRLIPAMGGQYGLFYHWAWPADLDARYQIAKWHELGMSLVDRLCDWLSGSKHERVADVAADAIDWFIAQDGPQPIEAKPVPTPDLISEMEPERELVGARN